MVRIPLDEFLREYHIEDNSNLKLINIRGTGGSGKSSIVNMLRDTDPDTFEVFAKIDNKKNNVTVCTVFPNYKILALGKYTQSCGGCDTFKDIKSMNQKQYPRLSDFYKDLINIFDHVGFHIIMEGLMISGIYGAYQEMFLDLQKRSKREIIIYTLLPPLSVCLERQKIRRNGVEVNPFHTVSKYRSIVRFTARFAKDFKSIVVDSSLGDRDFNFNEFFRRTNIECPKIEDKFFSDEW